MHFCFCYYPIPSDIKEDDPLNAHTFIYINRMGFLLLLCNLCNDPFASFSNCVDSDIGSLDEDDGDDAADALMMHQ